MAFFILGGAYPIGQLLAVEFGRYEIWDYRHRLFNGALLYLISFVPVTAILSALNWDLGLLPWTLFVVLILLKASLNQLNMLMPNKFQPSSEELKEKYGEVFKVDQAEVKAIIESDFAKKLGFSRRNSKAKPKVISFLRGEDLEDEEGLTEAVEEFMEKERRRKRGDGI